MVGTRRRRGPGRILPERSCAGADVPSERRSRLPPCWPYRGDSRACPATDSLGCRTGALVRPLLPTAGVCAILRASKPAPSGYARYSAATTGSTSRLDVGAHVWNRFRHERFDGARVAGESAWRYRELLFLP